MKALINQISRSVAAEFTGVNQFTVIKNKGCRLNNQTDGSHTVIRFSDISVFQEELSGGAETLPQCDKVGALLPQIPGGANGLGWRALVPFGTKLSHPVTNQQVVAGE